MWNNQRTYTPAGIATPTIWGWDSRTVLGLGGLAASVMTGGLVGLLGAGVALGSLTSYQTSEEVRETYNLAQVEFAARQLGMHQAPVKGIGQWDTPPSYIEGNASYVPALLAA